MTPSLSPDTIICYYYSSNLLFWNKQYFPSKGIESWNVARTWVNIEIG